MIRHMIVCLFLLCVTSIELEETSILMDVAVIEQSLISSTVVEGRLVSEASYTMPLQSFICAAVCFSVILASINSPFSAFPLHG